MLADRVRERLEGLDGIVHASLIGLEPVTVLLVGTDRPTMDGPAWRYRTGSLRQLIAESTGDRPVFEEITAAELTELIRENDPRVRGWRDHEMHLIGSDLFTLVQDVRFG